MLILGVRPSPAPQSVEGRDAECRGEVAVAAAAGRALGQLEAEPRSDPVCLGEKAAMAGVRSIGGRLKPPRTRHSCSGGQGRRSPQRRLDCGVRGQRRGAYVDLGRRVCRYDVGGRAALDDADVHGRAGCGSFSSVDVAEPGGPARRLRCSALLGRNASVGGLAFDLEGIGPRPSAPSSEPPSARGGSSTRT